MVAITCLVYLAVQLALGIYAAVVIGTMGTESDQILSEGGWVYFYIVAIVIFAVVANTYSVAVASFWILVALSSIVTLLGTAFNLSFALLFVIFIAISKLCMQSRQ